MFFYAVCAVLWHIFYLPFRCHFRIIFSGVNSALFICTRRKAIHQWWWRHNCCTHFKVARSLLYFLGSYFHRSIVEENAVFMIIRKLAKSSAWKTCSKRSTKNKFLELLYFLFIGHIFFFLIYWSSGNCNVNDVHNIV